MRLIVTGANGQLGSYLRELVRGKEGIEAEFIDVDTLDLTDAGATGRYFDEQECDAVVNCAAYTNVDGAEKDVEAARRVNAKAVKNLAENAVRRGFRVIHISTDYVFDGTKGVAYDEEDSPNPLNAYGATKREGEELLLSTAPDSIVIRTAWLYSNKGRNFYLTMHDRSRKGLASSVVDNQIGSPTFASDLAQSILLVVERDDAPGGIYHCVNAGSASWYDFAREIYALNGADPELVTPASDYPSAAKRPGFSALNTDKIKDTFGIRMRDWKEALRECVSEASKNT